MNFFLTLAFLFFIGSTVGWGIEVIFRRFFSGANPERRWINPGFLTGPYLPLYGFGLIFLYLIASAEAVFPIADPVVKKLVLFLFMAAAMTLTEYVAGLIFIKKMKVKLWDYSKRKGNVQGIICPLFSFFWAVLGALYYFLVHPHILDALAWLSSNLAFSFVIGFFYGVLTLDFCRSSALLVRIRRFAEEREIIVRYEELKQQIKELRYGTKRKFFVVMSSHLSKEAFTEFMESSRRKAENLVEKLRPRR
ncbi:MAG: putative ABC transporter permease [Clostridia bacterium]|nr:putative ABC transporter permease [Clostridia bacterium]